HWYRDHAPDPEQPSNPPRVDLRRRRLLDIWHVNDRAGQNRHAGRGIQVQGSRVLPTDNGQRLGRRGTVVCWEVQRPAVRQEDPRIGATAEAGGTFHNRIEHRLDIGLRLADDAQDVARGGLLVECRGQLTVTCLYLREQPHILDRDHRLIGEGLEELNLTI